MMTVWTDFVWPPSQNDAETVWVLQDTRGRLSGVTTLDLSASPILYLDLLSRIVVYLDSLWA